MSGCFGNHLYDRFLESELDRYLDSQDWHPCENCTKPDWCADYEWCRILKVEDYLELRGKRNGN